MISVFLMAAAVTLTVPVELPPESAVKPVEVLKTGDYSEGVVVDHDGNLYISHGKIVTKVYMKGPKKSDTWAETGSPNGHKILADGTHLICDASKHAVLHLDDESREMAAESLESDGQPLRAPNDLTLDTANGGVYFTDPRWFRGEAHRHGSLHQREKSHAYGGCRFAVSERNCVETRGQGTVSRREQEEPHPRVSSASARQTRRAKGTG